MRAVLLLLLSACLGLTTTAQRPMVMPPALKAGDTIAVLSPSSTPDAETVEKGCDALREWG